MVLLMKTCLKLKIAIKVRGKAVTGFKAIPKPVFI